jgi:hypothetical protein
MPRTHIVKQSAACQVPLSSLHCPFGACGSCRGLSHGQAKCCMPGAAQFACPFRLDFLPESAQLLLFGVVLHSLSVHFCHSVSLLLVRVQVVRLHLCLRRSRVPAPSSSFVFLCCWAASSSELELQSFSLQPRPRCFSSCRCLFFPLFLGSWENLQPLPKVHLPVFSQL